MYLHQIYHPYRVGSLPSLSRSPLLKLTEHITKCLEILRVRYRISIDLGSILDKDQKHELAQDVSRFDLLHRMAEFFQIFLGDIVFDKGAMADAFVRHDSTESPPVGIVTHISCFENVTCRGNTKTDTNVSIFIMFSVHDQSSRIEDQGAVFTGNDQGSLYMRINDKGSTYESLCKFNDQGLYMRVSLQDQ